MKNNTNKTKDLVAEAIRNLPQDFALTDARHYLLKAYNEIEEVENKRAKRENIRKPQKGFSKVANERTSQVAAESPHWTPQQILGIVNYIDQQILEAKQKIDEIQKSKTQPEPSPDFHTERKLLED